MVDLPESVVVPAGLEPGIARTSAALNGNTVSQDLTVLNIPDI